MKRPKLVSCPGFTLVEMLAVLLIMGILAAATIGVTARNRNVAWEHKAGDTARQIAQAWVLYLNDFREFPEDVANKTANAPNKAAGDAIEYISPKEGKQYNDDGHGRTYLELSDKERDEGLFDHWKRPFYFILDGDYDAKIQHPAPEASGLKQEEVTGYAIAWSKGADPEQKKKWIVEWK